MTTQEAKQVLDWIAEGKCEYKYEHNFRPYPFETSSSWLLTGAENFSDYRRTPEPKLRPWKSIECKVGTVLRHDHWEAGAETTVLAVSAGCSPVVTFLHPSTGEMEQSSMNELLNNYKQKSDSGQWSKCGVQE